MVSEDLLRILVCPMGKAPLRREGDTLVCTRCGPRFTIKDDIPNMLIEEAELPAGCASLADLECVRSGDAARFPLKTTSAHPCRQDIPSGTATNSLYLPLPRIPGLRSYEVPGCGVLRLSGYRKGVILRVKG